jgi:hypothetical protein
MSTIANETFKGLAFPVAKVRFNGPTDHRGARYSATIRRDNERTYRTTVSFDYAKNPGENALSAALKCLERALEGNGSDSSVDDYVAIPGDLDASAYSFTFVPKYFFA